MEALPSIWERHSSRLYEYSRREPEKSALYQILYNYRDEFEQRYEELFEEWYGFLRGNVLDSFDAYLNCGILKHGCARAVCEECNHSELIAFSCKERVLCPSCSAKRSHIFAETLHEKILLPHPHKHFVFTIPKRLRLYFKYDRGLFKLLYQAAWKAWKDYAEGIHADGIHRHRCKKIKNIRKLSMMSTTIKAFFSVINLVLSQVYTFCKFRIVGNYFET